MQHARRDRPGGLGRRNDGVGLREAVDDTLTGDRARDQYEHAGEHEAPAGRAQGLAPTAARDPDGEHEQQQGRQRQHDGESAQGCGHVLHGRRLAARDDRDSARVRGDLPRQLARQPEALHRVEHQRPQIEVDGLARDRDERGLALGDRDEALRRKPVGLLPRLLHARPTERLVGDILRDVLQAAGGRAGERLQARRQRSRQLLADVDVRVDLIDQVSGDGGLDGRVVQQRLLVSAQLSAFSSCRLAHTETIASTATIVARASSARTA